MGLSLTKKQVQSDSGAELLHLLSEGADAGWVSDDPIRNLHEWLRSNSDSAIPAVPFLTKLTDEVLSNGQITSDARHALRLAVERVLPPDHRDPVKLKRRMVEADEHAKAKDSKLAEKERAREYARLSRPKSFNFMVAGITYEGRAETIREHVREEQRVFLIREPQNRHDRNAIAIWVGENGNTPSSEQTTFTSATYEIGYVPRDIAVVVAPLLDAGYKQLAVCPKILTNSSHGPIPIIDVSLYHPEGNAPRKALRISWDQSTSAPSTQTDQRYYGSKQMDPLIPGWLILLLLIFLGFVVFFAVIR